MVSSLKMEQQLFDLTNSNNFQSTKPVFLNILKYTAGVKMSRFSIFFLLFMAPFHILKPSIHANEHNSGQPTVYPKNYFRYPLNIPPSLAGNFGDLRTNHYHMGIDLRTQQRENLPVVAAADGYISHIRIEPYGYGHAIFITHPNGYTTVYGHLNKFFPALETYLRNNYTYDSKITAPPSGTEAASWFLFQSRRGYCNYFATAMALLARELGIPARVAAGYTNGTLNDKTGNWDINGTDAHAWTQIYFAGYGWINFEPSATFSTFVRPVKSSTVPGNQVNPGGSAPGDKNGSHNRLNLGDHESDSTTAPQGTTDTAAQIRTDVGIVLLILIAFIMGGLIYFTFWWRRLYRGLSVPTQLYGRVSLLAGWSGVVHRRSQTPREYMQTVATVAPEDAVVIERLGDIYTRERWADPESAEHPQRSGESADLPGIWQPLQRRLMVYMVRHPYFLRSLPSWLGGQTRRFFFRGARRSSSTVVVEEHLEQ